MGAEVMVLPDFPLLFVDEEGSSHTLTDVEDIETTVEFIDDYDPPYRCFDAQGRRVRLILYALELLVCQIVPEDFDSSRVRVMESVGGGHAEPLLVECVDDFVLRTLGGSPVRAAPSAWHLFAQVATAEPLVAGSVAPTEFHQRWMKARLGRRF
ncbi:MAG: hypothetical protein JXA67_11845 [Micromonosporaceae bacterium]|nr:hypothetical protein [Micromonosporaceae bacterium]